MSFDTFYQHYPRKVAKGAAEKAWDKIKPDADMEKQMILAIQAQVKYRKDAENHGQFMPPWKHPATWLNGHCWLDEIPSHSALKDKHEPQKCGCGQPVIHAPLGLCIRCYCDRHPHPMLDKLREVFVRHKIHLLKTPQEHIAYQKKMLITSGMFIDDTKNTPTK